MLELEPDLDISTMKVPELKKELKARGLSVTGNKNELVERLQVALLSSVDSDIMAKADELLGDDPEDVASPSLDVAKGVSSTLLKRDTALPTTTAPDLSAVSKNSAESKKELTDAEKAALRLARFGSTPSQSNDLAQKKVDRAKRFGLPIPSPGEAAPSNGSSKTPADLDLLKKRAERFGAVSSATMKQLEDAEKIQKRKERFGLVDKDAPSAKKAAFALNKTLTKPAVDPEAAEKLKKRAERFGLA